MSRSTSCLRGVFSLAIFIVWSILIPSSPLLTENGIYLSNYAVVIDAGSTGSRCFVFKIDVNANDARTVTGIPCGKVVPGLSTFANKPEEAGANMAPLLINAANIIPSQRHQTTTVHIKATAGMRILKDEEQSLLWKNLVSELNYRIDVPFSISEYNVDTIDGHDEAFFAVLASNYIHGSIDGNLHPVDGMPMLGALDMGGGSTQLIFYNGTRNFSKVNANDFWSHSWSNFGVNRVQQRVLSYLLAEYRRINQIADIDGMGEVEVCENENMINNSSRSFECRTKVIIPNPCSFKDFHYQYSEFVSFQGTGEGHLCLELIERVIWPIADVEDSTSACKRGRPCPIEAIEHPTVRGHHFYAMSVYFYALDCMRQLTKEEIRNWPNPALADVEKVAFDFCGMEWNGLLNSFMTENRHVYTRDDQLHDRCFESLYIITLLEKGFGFDRFERSITFALEVGGSEVEWTLGFALAEIDFRPHRESIIETL